MNISKLTRSGSTQNLKLILSFECFATLRFNFKLNINKLIFIFIFVFSIFQFHFAQVDYISSPLQIKTVDTTITSPNNFLFVQDIHFPIITSTNVAHTGSKGQVILYVDYDEHEVVPDTMEYFVDVKVKWYGGSPLLPVTEFKTLHIFYTKYGESLDREELRKTNVYKIEVNVLRVKDKSGQLVPFTNVNGRIKIMANISADEIVNVCMPSYTAVGNYNLSASLNAVKKVININWSPVSCAEFYELEWVYIDDYGPNNTIIPSNKLYPYFRDKAMRVRVKGGTSYQLPAIFDRGYVLFRVRAVQKQMSGDYFYFPWSMPDNYDPVNRKGLSSVASLLVPPYNDDIVQINSSNVWEPNRNWVYELVVDEEGNGHHLVSYYDGLFLKKQEVSVVNGDSVALVKEWIYDVHGKEGVEVLPSVETHPSSLNGVGKLLEYYMTLNKNTANPSQKYSYKDFMLDSTQVAGCGQYLPGQMNKSSGSAKYYSNQNGYMSNAVPGYSYVPDANGYPFVVKRYTNEPEPRIRESGLAGDSLQAGGQHSTLYFYGTPLQEELDRLLGNNAGYANHYVKVLVKDANGGWRSEIKDTQGKLVITSLVKSAPNTMPVDTAGIQDSIKSVLISRANGEILPGMTADSLGDVYMKTIVTTGGSARFTYSVEANSFVDTCSNACYDCVWDLKLKVISSCGNDYTPNNVPNQLGVVVPDSVNFVCDTVNKKYSVSVVQNWGEGEVSIVRELSLNVDALKKYYEHWLANNHCIKSYEDFLNEELQKIDSSLCNTGCSGCADSLFTGGNEALPPGTSLCNTECDSSSLGDMCSNIYMIMLGDVSPGGQYATYTRDTLTGAMTWNGDDYSIFNNSSSHTFLPKNRILSYNLSPQIPPLLPSSFAGKYPYQYPIYFNGVSWVGDYLDENGNIDKVDLDVSSAVSNQYLVDTTKKWLGANGVYYTYPKYLKPEEFIDRFKPSWAKSLVIYHPEFIYWWECDHSIKTPTTALYGNTFAFDDSLQAHPEKLIGSGGPTFNSNIIHNDPFFNSTYGMTKMGVRWMRPYDWANSQTSSFCSGGKSAKDRMMERIANYNNSGKSLFQIANMMSNCGTVPTATNVVLDTSAAEMAVLLYTSLKHEVLMEYLHKRAMLKQAYNGVIGSVKTYTSISTNTTTSSFTPVNGNLPNISSSWWFNVSCGSGSSPHSNLTQISNYQSYLVLSQKDKRWGRMDELMGLDTAWYEGVVGKDGDSVAKCRCTKQEALNSLIQMLFMTDSLNTGLSAGIDSCSFYNVAGLSALTGGMPASVTSTIVPPGKQLELKIGNACVLPNNVYGANVELTISNTSTVVFGYNKIVGIQNLQYTGSASGVHYFTMSLWYYDANDSLRKEIINGKTCLDIDCLKDTMSIDYNSCNEFNCSYCNDRLPQILNLIMPDSCFLDTCINRFVYSTQCCYYAGCPLNSWSVSANNPNVGVIYSSYTVPVNCQNYYLKILFSKPISSIFGHSITSVFIPYRNTAYCTDTLWLVLKDVNTGIITDTVKIKVIDKGQCPEQANTGACYYHTTIPEEVIKTNTLVCADVPNLEGMEADSLEDGCLAAQVANAANVASVKYQAYMDSLKNYFVEAYVKQCKKLKEFMEIALPEQEEYYTLYLYDDVGNLLETVPPEGVVKLSATQVAQVQAYRLSGAGGLYPLHNKRSEYRYNSLNAKVVQETPDGGRDTMMYDNKFRLAAMQNSRMKDSLLYGYIKYDYRGRVVEQGIGKSSAVPTMSDLSAWNHPQNWISGRRERVVTLYDVGYSGLPSGYVQKHLKNRVSARWRDEDGDNVVDQVYAYSYDVLGNVERMYSYVRELDGFGVNIGWKRLRYEYDVVSGKVKGVYYQEGVAGEQWLHKYRYDGMNRLVSVKTSRDGWNWEEDGRYRYYLHRVMMRKEYGDRRVAGQDNIFTINGWMKGMNGFRNDENVDAGGDGKVGGTNQYTGKDVMSYEIGYYGGDYRSVSGVMLSVDSFVSLYNGNIGRVVISEDTLQEMGRRYRYDGLNRLRVVEHRKNAGSGYVSVNEYEERFDYDRDGNITNVLRWAKGSVMDSLKYVYYAGNNRLRRVLDGVPNNLYTWDIDNQIDVDNYEYDKTGNLVKDKSENMLIRWTYYNKVKSIDSVSFGKRLEFAYDANGDRVVKYDVKNKRKEIYIKDAQGNTLAVYEIKVGSLIDSLFTREFNIYGTERIGYLEDRNYLGKKTKGKTVNLSPISTMKTLPTLPPSISPLPTTPTFTTFLGGSGSSLVGVYYGKKRYELSDWLGNVRVVVSDKKVQDNVSGVVVLNYKPEVLSIRDYYAFGSEINERNFEPIKPKYRYGFNSKENDNEIYGNGNALNFGDRIYNSRLGYFLSVDKMFSEAPEWTPYRFGADNPNLFVDKKGNFEVPIHKEITENVAKQNKLNMFQIKALSIGVQNADYMGFGLDLHFDNRKNFSEIQSTWKSINEVKSIIKRTNDYYALGILLHTVQDFYSHSNYVELYVQYYKDQGGDMSKFSADMIPLFEDGIKIKEFREKYLEPKLRTGDFDLKKNEKFDFFGLFGDFDENDKNTHYRMNKDSNKSLQGKEKVKGTKMTYHDLAKNVATRATDKILKEKKKK